MATRTEPYTVQFPSWYDAQAEFETPLKGHLPGVTVRMEDGTSFALYFSDPVCLQQTLADDVRSGRAYYAEPGLVVVPEVTTASIQEVVAGLWRDGFFCHLKPLDADS
jgi:hypothetical protein